MKHLKDKNRPWLKATKTRYMHRRSRCSMLPCIFPLRQKGINLSLKLFVVKQLLSGCRSNLDHLKDDHFHSAAIWYSNCENKCAHTQGSDRRPLNPATTHCCLLHQQWSKQKYYCQPSSTHKQQTAAGVCVCMWGESTGLSSAQHCASYGTCIQFAFKSKQHTALRRQEVAQQANISSIWFRSTKALAHSSVRSIYFFTITVVITRFKF